MILSESEIEVMTQFDFVLYTEMYEFFTITVALYLSPIHMPHLY